ncbi:hypothetical protein B0J11DRAFT_74865 [Dendryphion nanum]|uniref:Uncharacterized protein n=1 Tax=Dendryphion nanum TaxID=256645 RepID=A0A9P9IGR7_9PLEO|nr:hypothetical protein B0J11DRAFT_74865 [Dendryphion nanum]
MHILLTLLPILSALPLALAIPTTSSHHLSLSPRQRRPDERGRISLYLTSGPNSNTPLSRVGCLNAYGRLINTSSPSLCAIYTLAQLDPFTGSTTQGQCGYHDERETVNDDAGFGWYAFTCRQELRNVSLQDQLSPVPGPNGITHLVTAAGSGPNWMWYAKRGSAGENDAVEVFFQGPKLGEGRLSLVALWEREIIMV